LEGKLSPSNVESVNGKAKVSGTITRLKTYLRKKNKIYIMAATKITVNSNGSLKIEGDFQIVDAQGTEYGLQGRTTLGLCRCGLAKNKPFCDGSHNGHLEHQAIAFDLPPKKV
jgi:CDGSH-type Zn-finger protein